MATAQKPPREPDHIKGLMSAWRDGLIPFPVEYTQYHKDLAEKRIEELKHLFSLRVYDLRMINDGWGDRFRVLEAVCETLSGKLLKLKWNDSNRDYMVDVGCGHAALHPHKDLI